MSSKNAQVAVFNFLTFYDLVFLVLIKF